jgi:hypothetical protein
LNTPEKIIKELRNVLNEFLNFKSNVNIEKTTFETILKEVNNLKKPHSDLDCPTWKADPCDDCKKRQLAIADPNCKSCAKKQECSTCNSMIILNSLVDGAFEDFSDHGKAEKGIPLCMVLDNFDNLICEDKYDDSIEKIQHFYKQLTNFLRESDFTFRFVFVTSKAIDLPMPKLQLCYPSVEYLTEYVSEVVHKEINDPTGRCKMYEFFGIRNIDKDDRKVSVMNRNINNFIGYIVKSVTDTIRDYKVLNAVIKKFIEYAFYYKVIETKVLGDSILVNRCTNFAKLIGCNPKIAFKPIQDIMRQIDEVFNQEGGVLNEVDSLHVRLTKSELRIAEKQSMDSFSLPAIPSVLLIACFVTNVKSEKLDASLVNNASRFKKSNRITKRVIQQDETGIVTRKPAYKERIEFYAQFFLDLVLKEKNLENKNRELRLAHQSAQFIMSYQLLEDHKFMKRLTPMGNDECTNVKFLCLCETAKIDKLADNLGLTLGEFVNTN